MWAFNAFFLVHCVPGSWYMGNPFWRPSFRSLPKFSTSAKRSKSPRARSVPLFFFFCLFKSCNNIYSNEMSVFELSERRPCWRAHWRVTGFHWSSSWFTVLSVILYLALLCKWGCTQRWYSIYRWVLWQLAAEMNPFVSMWLSYFVSKFSVTFFCLCLTLHSVGFVNQVLEVSDHMPVEVTLKSTAHLLQARPLLTLISIFVIIWSFLPAF